MGRGSRELEDELSTQVFFNPRCSKCRTVRAILEEKGHEAEYVRYLEQVPTHEDLEHVLGLLGTNDPRDMIRTNEGIYRELGLASADRDALIDAMVQHPILIERPIVIHGDRAVIGRPPERALELFREPN
ncbi:MAG TPA: arsenate reductase (glutaredoxin) [Actinomycetota bacterium]|nr:arsenate reductase (glutaredoxin) [Actinomycetota bacterium]